MYLVGHSVTLADIIMICNLTLGFNRLLTKNFTLEFPHVERYFWTLVNQPNFRKILGEVKQAESVPAVQSAKKPSQPKEPAKKEAKKEEKKEPAKPKVEEALEEERHPSPRQRILLIFCLLARGFWMNGKGFIQTQRPTSVRLLSKASGTCMIQRVTPFGFVITNTTMKIQFHL